MLILLRDLDVLTGNCAPIIIVYILKFRVWMMHVNATAIDEIIRGGLIVRSN